jgi:alkylation response protein AidB-like acyl-CoA dehydrogenase
MHFDLTEPQRLIRDLARDFAEREVMPRAAEIDRADEFPWDLYKRMAAVQLMLADMSVRIESSRLLLRRAAWLKDQGRPIIREAAEAKLVASEAAARATDDALQIHGAYGYSTEFPVERLYRDARVYRIWEGTSEIQRLVIARQLLK